MVVYKSISYFRKRLVTLMKAKRGVYATVGDEINREFVGKTIDSIRQNNDMILLEGDLVVIKLRLPDKKRRLAKKDGYRLVYLVSKVTPVVVFLDVYPKNGPMQQLDEDDATIKQLVSLFISEGETGTLQDYVIQ